MAYWKWGVHFAGAASDHYRFMRNEDIIIGHAPHTPYQVDDLVVVTDGFAVKAIARVAGAPQPITNFPQHEAECLANGIAFVATTIVADAEWDDYAFRYPLVRAGNQIHDLERIRMIRAIWDQRNPN